MEFYRFLKLLIIFISLEVPGIYAEVNYIFHLLFQSNCNSRFFSVHLFIVRPMLEGNKGGIDHSWCHQNLRVIVESRRYLQSRKRRIRRVDGSARMERLVGALDHSTQADTSVQYLLEHVNTIVHNCMIISGRIDSVCTNQKVATEVTVTDSFIHGIINQNRIKPCNMIVL